MPTAGDDRYGHDDLDENSRRDDRPNRASARRHASRMAKAPGVPIDSPSGNRACPPENQRQAALLAAAGSVSAWTLIRDTADGR